MIVDSTLGQRNLSQSLQRSQPTGANGIRVEFNFVPGRGHLGDQGRLGPDGSGPADRYGETGLTNSN